MSQNRTGSNILDLALEALRGANLLTPVIAGVFSIVKRGREAGKDDEAVKAESMQFAQDTVTEADRQLSIRPNSQP